MGKSLAELRQELKKQVTSTRYEIAKAKYRRRSASFASLVASLVAIMGLNVLVVLGDFRVASLFFMAAIIASILDVMG